MDMVKIGKFIASLRQEKHWTQQQLGEKLGVTNKTVSRWETGSYLPPVEILQLLGQTFDVTINELLAGERLSAETFREKSEENLQTVLQESSFSVRERYAYWKGKWKKEHRWLRAAFPVGAVGLLLRGFWIQNIWWCAAASLVCLVGHMFVNNRMMAYIEGHTFSDPQS